jgi:hypothetical protein
VEPIIDFLEKLVYSNKVKKFNKFDWAQERILVITNLKLYNFKKNSKFTIKSNHFYCVETKRKIPIAKLLGVTKSVSKPYGEFVLHIKDEYDYRMKSD